MGSSSCHYTCGNDEIDFSYYLQTELLSRFFPFRRYTGVIINNPCVGGATCTYILYTRCVSALWDRPEIIIICTWTLRIEYNNSDCRCNGTQSNGSGANIITCRLNVSLILLYISPYLCIQFKSANLICHREIRSRLEIIYLQNINFMALEFLIRSIHW